ncbi:MAG TPA: hypothetical protein VND41_00210 [Nitrososphaerales archaeon]|nr:hypothetical protein [Nitrososphaerales archaeon]
MQKRLPKLMGATVLVLLTLSFLAATPARAACPVGAGECIAAPYSVPAEPVWATLNAVPEGNYPGGNLIFDVFVVNADQPPHGNVTLINETVTAPALPAASQSNSGIGLPVELLPGQAILSTIALQIPDNFTQSNLTASLVVNVLLWNGTMNIPLQLTGALLVYILGLPISGTQTTTSSTSQSTQTVAQSGTVSTTLFAVGVAIPSIVAVILLVLLARGRGSKGGP